MTAAKIIRIPDAQIVLDFFDQFATQIDGKIVILVRDPRAMLQSRRIIASWDGLWKRDRSAMLNQLENECASSAANKKVAERTPEKVRIIRYEDFALDPTNQTEQIYKYLNLEMRSEIAEFLHVSTSTDDETKYAKGEEFMQIYSTSRKSTKTLNKWRTDMDFELMMEVQKRCLDMMRTFDYIPFGSEKALKNVTLTYF